MADLVYPPVIALARAVFGLQGLRFEIRGAHNIPRTGGAVLAINHVGYFDFTYERSLDVLAAGRSAGLVTKSNLILGLGEERSEVVDAMRDLHTAGTRASIASA